MSRRISRRSASLIAWTMFICVIADDDGARSLSRARWCGCDGSARRRPSKKSAAESARRAERRWLPRSLAPRRRWTSAARRASRSASQRPSCLEVTPRFCDGVVFAVPRGGRPRRASPPLPRPARGAGLAHDAEDGDDVGPVDPNAARGRRRRALTAKAAARRLPRGAWSSGPPVSAHGDDGARVTPAKLSARVEVGAARGAFAEEDERGHPSLSAARAAHATPTACGNVLAGERLDADHARRLPERGSPGARADSRPAPRRVRVRARGIPRQSAAARTRAKRGRSSPRSCIAAAAPTTAASSPTGARVVARATTPPLSDHGRA